jgi:malate dehydrogenase (oxaloacetate-decarboxylating)
MDYQQKSIEVHRKAVGKISIENKLPIENKEDLSIAYTPGVAGVSLAISKDENEAYGLTSTKNMVAVISDGSAVLGLGDIGPLGAIPVMEGKCALFKKFAGLDAFPIVLDVHTEEEIIDAVLAIAPTFGGINLEDISGPKCFNIEKTLIDRLDIPVMHDDQHGTAIVVLAGLINALKVSGKEKENVKLVINGAGAAGIANAKLLSEFGFKNIILCDSKGALSKNRDDLNFEKLNALTYTNPNNESGSIHEVIAKADIFIGLSKGSLLTENDVKNMAEKSIIFAMANPTPEIMPDVANKAGAYIVATGRSDFPNQVNNVLAFPGVFKGAMEKRSKITNNMKIAAATALADMVGTPDRDKIIPNPFEEGLASKVSEAVKKAI